MVEAGRDLLDATGFATQSWPRRNQPHLLGRHLRWPVNWRSAEGMTMVAVADPMTQRSSLIRWRTAFWSQVVTILLVAGVLGALLGRLLDGQPHRTTEVAEVIGAIVIADVLAWRWPRAFRETDPARESGDGDDLRHHSWRTVFSRQGRVAPCMWRGSTSGRLKAASRIVGSGSGMNPGCPSGMSDPSAIVRA